MSSHDVLGVEIGAAVGILGLLLVFLPLFIESAARARGGTESEETRRRRLVQAWAASGLVAVAAADATLGLVSLWGKWSVADATGWLLIALVWLIVALAAVAVKTGVK